MGYLTNLLDIEDRVGKLAVTSETIKLLKENQEKRKVFESNIDSLGFDIINSGLNAEERESYLKRINDYKQMLRDVPKPQNSLQQALPYAVAFGAGIFVGYLLKGEIDSYKDIFMKNIMSGFNKEIGKR